MGQIVLQRFLGPLALAIVTSLHDGTYANQLAPTVSEVSSNHAQERWSSLLTAQEVHQRLAESNTVVIDVRSAAEYTAGHIPGALNMPAANWRTPPARPGSGAIGQQIFRRPDGSLDVERYERLLGDAGIRADDDIVVYGNHAGRADGTVPAAILLKLGHERIAFLDGIGIEQWKQAGYPVSQKPTKRDPTTYETGPAPDRLWSYHDVLKNLDNPDVVIIDSRTAAEFAGTDLRGNKRGGHIPGARLLNSEDFLDAQSLTTISPDEARRKVEAVAPKGKTIVIYCQSGTRCSLKELILKDLGYTDVVLYDASWQEWGNRDDTPVETDDAASSTPRGDK
jgi:thiosulfate/3-mercaptopyruvate sulfurtransferase